MTETLPAFGSTTECPKCGHGRASTEYRATGTCVHDAPGGSVVDHSFDVNPRLHRTCRRCGYSWDEACVDDQPPAAQPQTKDVTGR